MGLDIEFKVLIWDARRKLYCPLYEEDNEFIIYDEPETEINRNELYEYDMFSLLSFYKPYPLSYYLVGFGHPFVDFGMKRFKGRDLTGISELRVHSHFKHAIERCTCIDLHQLDQHDFNIKYKLCDNTEKNLANYKPTKELRKLIRDVVKQFPNLQAGQILLVVDAC
jgi:hypothetical protein